MSEFENTKSHEVTSFLAKLGRSELAACELEELRKERFDYIRSDLDRFFAKLDEKFEGWNKSQITSAIGLMLDLHFDQSDRPDGAPFIAHPLAVAETVMDLTDDPDLTIAGLLHDSVEDQPKKLASMYIGKNAETEDDQTKALLVIADNFGDKVSKIVKQLTNPDFETKLRIGGIDKFDPEFKEYRNKMYTAHVRQIIEDDDVLPIKMVDFYKNALTVVNIPDANEKIITRKAELMDKYRPVLDIFISRLNRDNLFPEYLEKFQTAARDY